MADPERAPRRGVVAIEALVLPEQPIRPSPAEGVRFAALQPGQEGELAMAMREAQVEVHGRIARGERVVIATIDGAIAGYGWACTDMVRSYEPPLVIPLPHSAAYIWDCATLLPFRGRGVFSGVLRHLLLALHLTGIRRVWAMAASANVPSMRAFASAGFRQVGTVTIVEGRLLVTPTDLALPAEARALTCVQQRYSVRLR